jgi:peptidoglycan/LPS O-acetylase OafA/YrhL
MISNLYFIRGIAALMVFLFHSHYFLKIGMNYPKNIMGLKVNISKIIWDLSPFSYGVTGVHVFILLSGFLMHHIYHKNLDMKDFFLRRFFRIYPLYFLVLVLSISLNFASFDSIDFITHVFLIHNFFDSSFYSLGPHLWTIALEFQLYICYSLLILLGMSSDSKFYYFFLCSILLSVGTFIQNYLTDSSSMILNNSVVVYLCVFLTGSEISIRLRNKKLILISPWILVSILSIYFILSGYILSPIINFCTLSTLYYFVFSSILSFEVSDKNIIWNFICFLGKISYSFYLIHVLTLEITPNIHFLNLTNHSSIFKILDIGLIFYITLAISYYSYTYIEVPIIEVGKKISKIIT